MIRHATRPLTGPAQSWTCYADNETNEPEVKLGRRPGQLGDTVRRRRPDANGDWRWGEEPAPFRGQPAVTVDLNASRSGARTFERPEELAALARELAEAADWLTHEQMFGPQAGEESQ